MTGPDAAHLRDALLAARDVAAARGVRLPRPRPSVQLSVPADRRGLEAAAAACLAGAGIDVGPWERELAKCRADANVRLEAIRADAIRQSAAHAEELRDRIEGQRNVLDQLQNTTGPIKYVVLDSPFLIWSTSGIVVDSTIDPWHSRADITFAGNWRPVTGPLGPGGIEELHFYYLWENPTGADALVDVGTFLVLNGFCQAIAHGGLFGGGTALMQLDAHLDLLGLPTPPLPQDAQSRVVLALGASALGLFSSDHTTPASVLRALDLRYEQLPVPVTGVVIDVQLSITYGIEPDASVNADFSSGDFEVGCPFVQLAILPG